MLMAMTPWWVPALIASNAPLRFVKEPVGEPAVAVRVTSPTAGACAARCVRMAGGLSEALRASALGGEAVPTGPGSEVRAMAVMSRIVIRRSAGNPLRAGMPPSLLAIYWVG